MKLILALLLVSSTAHASDCSTAAVLDENSDYETCRVTLDGKDTDQKIPESTCAAYCKLRKVNKRNDAYKSLGKQKKVTASAEKE